MKSMAERLAQSCLTYAVHVSRRRSQSAPAMRLRDHSTSARNQKGRIKSGLFCFDFALLLLRSRLLLRRSSLLVGLGVLASTFFALASAFFSALAFFSAFSSAALHASSSWATCWPPPSSSARPSSPALRPRPWSSPSSASRLRLIEQLHQRHRRGVARTRIHAQDARVAARTRLEARTEGLEQLHDHFRVAQLREGAATIGVAVVLAERDQRLDDAAQFLRLRHRRADRLVTQQRRRHVAKHRRAMRCVAAELPAGKLVTHCSWALGCRL